MTNCEIGRRFDIEVLAQTSITIAIDTEFEGTKTLTAQFAARDRAGRLCVQVYRSSEIEEPPALNLAEILGGLDGGLTLPRVYRIGILTRDLSPLRIIGDLLGIQDVISVSREIGYQRLRNPDVQPLNGEWDQRRGGWRVPQINVVLVGHFLAADLSRVFGRNFFRELFRPVPGVSDIELTGLGRLSFSQGQGVRANHDPIVEFAQTLDGRLYAIRLRTVDTTLPFGPGSLDRHSQTFLGVRKIDSINAYEKQRMLSTFRSRPSDSFAYAIRDAVLELRLHEEMQRRDREIFTAFDIPSDDIPAMRGTVGGRVSAFLVAATKGAARGSERLHGERSIKARLRAGGIQCVASVHGGSRFGLQTGAVHGGLSFTRTPTSFWHESPGLLRDVDMRSCYSEILQRIAVYWGRPVIWEPGNRGMTLAQAVEVAERHADADADAWFIRVTGNITALPNTLIPSTLNAMTHDNYRRRRSAIRHTIANSVKFPAKLFTARIESGVVTVATWAVIQALPTAARRDYESLQVETVILYPSQFVASTSDEFDELYDAFQNDRLPWTAQLDFEGRRLVETIVLDHEYVALRFPIAEYARRIEAFRREARASNGVGSAAELGWKLQANTMYGVLASPHHVTNNIVAANQITAQARSSAWAMFMALNGLQVITDGCSYRRDRIPTCTFRECLELQSDYPLLHANASAGIPFYDPVEIPDDDVAFNQWLRQHVRRFFEIDDATLDRILIHQLLKAALP
jgi:hypothetical protein